MAAILVGMAEEDLQTEALDIDLLCGDEVPAGTSDANVSACSGLPAAAVVDRDGVETCRGHDEMGYLRCGSIAALVDLKSI